jgi:two-component system sensor histidine kinase DesK
LSEDGYVTLYRLLKRRLPGALWTLAWMTPLIGPAVDASQGRVPHAGWALAGLLTFVALYLTIVTNAFDQSWPPSTTADFVMLVASAVIGLVLLWSYGDSGSWASVVLYISVSGVVVLGTARAVAWVAGCCLILVVYCTLGPARGADLGPWASLLFGLLLASALVFTIRQMLTYIGLLRSTREKLARTAVSEERLRFSRDLHDLLGHTLSVIVVKAEVVRRLAEQDPAAAAREAAEIETIGRQALAEVRDAVSGYREPDFATEVESVRSALMDAGMAVQVDPPVSALPPPANRLFGWAVREAATNAIRHSHALTCRIATGCDGGIATLEVVDDGVGADGHIGTSIGTGLTGLRERFAAAGGTLETSSQPGDGFRLTATVPITICTDQPALGATA